MTAPDFEQVAAHPGDGIERLERGMGEIGELVGRFEGPGGGCESRGRIAVVARRGLAGFGGSFTIAAEISAEPRFSAPASSHSTVT